MLRNVYKKYNLQNTCIVTERQISSLSSFANVLATLAQTGVVFLHVSLILSLILALFWSPPTALENEA